MAEQNATLRGSIQAEGALAGRATIPEVVGGGASVPIMSDTVAGIAKVGDNLKIDAAGRLSVDTADAVEGDNTRPITAAAVYSTVGNIEILLGTI